MTPRRVLRQADDAIEKAQRVVDIAVVARHYHVTPECVRRWIKAGRIRAEKTPSGRYKVLATDFEEIKSHGSQR